jgi:hypothetical protein
VLSLINYSASMGRGDVVSKENGSDEWEVIVAGTADESAFGYVCKN